MAKKINKSLLARRASQLIFLVVFFFLFIKTDYTGSDQLEYAVNILFRLDPLLAASTILATKTLLTIMFPALMVVAATLLWGRFFCGWFCPLGTILDIFQRLLPAPKKRQATIFPRLRLNLLIFVLAGAFFGLPLAGLIDPFSILVRGLALSVYPAINHQVTSFFTYTYLEAPESVNAFTEPVYQILKQGVLPFDQDYFLLAYLSAFILLAVIFAELVQRRFFCRNLCPLGALLGLIARLGLAKGQGGDLKCGKCHNCQQVCRMGAVDEERFIFMDSCNLCRECVATCPRQIIKFPLSGPSNKPAQFSLPRRQFVGSVAASTFLPLFSGVWVMAKRPDPFLVRPPGALIEKEFLGRCVRCGECMKVCIGNALQPVFLEAGLEGIYTPKLVARVGYCEFNCTLCGQVCPTGAIVKLGKERKQLTKIGIPYFDKNRCLPYAKGVPCIVCEEHCPTPDKAIKFREVQSINDQGEVVNLKQPYVIDKLCVGCGICENKCPLPGKAAVILTSAGEERQKLPDQ